MTAITIGALIIGLTLGMLGSGGSAITVPVLVYFVGHGAKESIAESMAIVGMISAVAAIPYAQSKLIDWRNVWFFGIPGMLGTFIGAWLGGMASESFQLVVFGVVLLSAAYLMLKKRQPEESKSDSETERLHQAPIMKIASEGTIVGVVTGFVGVGGGFLIVPALVVLGKLSMHKAVGTSLVIIAFKAVVGFAKYEHYLLANNSDVDTQTIFIFAVIGVLGSLLGRRLNSKLDQRVLQQVFAVFLLLLGGALILHEGSKLVNPPISKQVHATSIMQPSIEVESVADRPR